MNKIVYILETPVLNRDIERYEIHELHESGASVEIFDLSPILQPHASRMVKEDICDYNHENIRIVSSWSCLSDIISQNKQSLYVVKLGNGPYTYKLYKIFNVYDIKYILLLPEIVPSSFENKSKDHFASYIKKLRRNPFKSIFNSIYKRLLPWYNIKPAGFVLYSGDGGHELKNILSNYKVDKNTMYYSIASVAYKECKKIEKNDNRIIKEDYLVFIDQGFPVHPDLITSKINIPYDEYYSSINKTLKRLSYELGLKVVVAEHPRVSYCKRPFDNEFVCIKGKTNSLVKDSNLVVYHFSESINYIAYFNKPALVLTLDCLEKYFGYTIKAKADSIGAKVCNISKLHNDDYKLFSFISYNENKLSEYRSKYLSGNFEYESLFSAISSISKCD